MATRYSFDADTLACIHRIDRETDHYWWTECDNGRGGTYWNRWKKCPCHDRVFDTFEQARAELCRRLALRLDRAEDLTGPGFVSHMCNEDQEVA